MAAMAGALDTVLTKRDHYALGAGQRLPDAAMIGEARRLGRLVMALITASLVGALAFARFTESRSLQ